MSGSIGRSLVRTAALRRLRPTDLSAVAGAVVWAGLSLFGGLDAVGRALALAPLVLVPLGVGLMATPPFEGPAGRVLGLAIRGQPIGAVLLSVSLLPATTGLSAAALAAPWVAVTGLLGTAGVARTAERGLWPIHETVADAGLAYTVVGSVALVLSHLGVTFWFEPVIVLLTAVHFHYAGFVLPVVVGLTGRCGDARDDALFRALAAVVLVGPAIIAVGISFSPLVEVVAVGVFTAAVAVLGGYVVVRVAPTRPRRQRVPVAVSALALPVSMLLALGYGLSAFGVTVVPGLAISTMVAIHGTVNAFGFGLVGLAGWRLAVPAAEKR